jgi:hypothetical protein
MVLRDIVFADRRYFPGAAGRLNRGIASNILADRLKRLVKSGLLTREDTRPGQRARYILRAAPQPAWRAQLPRTQASSASSPSPLRWSGGLRDPPQPSTCNSVRRLAGGRRQSSVGAVRRDPVP